MRLARRTRSSSPVAWSLRETARARTGIGSRLQTAKIRSGPSSPAGLADGTVLHYYCSNHTSTMVTPNGTITIAAAAAPGPGIDPGGGGIGY